MSLGVQSAINKDRALWLSTIPSDVVHGNIICDTILANAGYISTLFSDNLTVSTLNTSTLAVQSLDVSGMFVSSIKGNTGFFSTVTLASDLSGGVGYVRFTVDASGIQVDGDPIRFDNLVYLTSTINIVQVSTIVDTDIFASNGYFSTLSTNVLYNNQGIFSSIVCQDLSGQNGSFDRLFVSSLEALDISGVASSNWSQYPTLTSSIIFQPAFVLSNVSNKLYFAGQELTDASGGGLDWSYFPALTDVSMNNFSIRKLSTLQYQDGATLVSQTGNNLFYNGQPVQYGAASNVSQWASYPAVSSVNLAGRNLSNAATVTTSNAIILGDNITSGYTFTNSLGVGGLSLVPIASLSAGGDLSVRNIEVGDVVTGLADVNIYGATALPGDNALYVQGGVQFDGGSIHGFSAGLLPVAGINTGRIDMVQAGFNILHPLVGAITTGAAMSITSGGALSVAAGGYVEMNTSTLQMINTSQGNKNTTVQAGFLTVDPDVAATSSIKLFNTLGGGVEIDGGGQGSLTGFSTLIGTNLSSINLQVSTINGHPFSTVVTPANIVADTVTANLFMSTPYIDAASTLTSSLRANSAVFSTVGWNFAVGVSTVLGAAIINNIQIADNITGITNAPNPLQSRIENFSSVQSGAMSTGDIRLSSINGLNWNDISGGGGGGVVSTFSTLQTSTFKVGTMNGSYPVAPGVSTLFMEGGLQFVGDQTGTPGFGSRFISSLRLINNLGQGMITLVSTNVIDWTGGNPNGFMRIGDGGAFDAFFRTVGIKTALSTPTIVTDNISTNSLAVSTLSAKASILTIDASNTIIPSQSTINLAASYIQTSTITANPPYTGEIFFDGQLRPLNNIIVLYNNNILFQDSTGASQYLTAQQLVSQEFPCFINPGGGFGSNLGSVGANAFYAGPGTGAFGAAKFYTEFPGTSWGIDIIDANGTTLFESINSYDTGGFTFQTNVYGVSSITSYNGATGFDSVVTAPTISTQNLLVSSINGAPVDNNTFDNQFSTLYVSSLNFSTSFSYGSNTGTRYPIFIEQDHAGGMTAGDAVAIAVQGHNLGSGAVRNQIEIGARGSGENYIMSVWPGQNLEELFIDATDLTVRDGIFSTIINLDPWGLQTTGGIKGPFISTLDINVSTINGSIYPWTSTLGGVVSTFTVDGTTATTPQLIGEISFPYGGDYWLSQKVAFTKVTGGSAQDCHGIMLLNGGGLPTFPGGDFGMGALPYINENGASSFTTVVTNINLLSSGTKQIYYYDATGNNYTASLITDLPVVHFNPGPPA